MRRTFVLLVVALLSVIAVPSLASAQDSASTATTAQSCHLSTTGAAGPKLGFGYTITGKHRLANYNQTGCWGAKRFPGSSRSMQSVACGIVSMSMAATTLTGQPWHPMRVARKLKYVMSGGNMYWYAPPKMDRMETAGPKFGLWVHNVGRSYVKVKSAGRPTVMASTSPIPMDSASSATTTSALLSSGATSRLTGWQRPGWPSRLVRSYG
jgi:hypothetical protein